MIITELYDGQGLGNQLWVYAASRSIAEELNVPFILLGTERFKGKGFLHIDSLIGISNEEAAKVSVSGRWSSFHEAIYYDRELDYFSSGFDSRVLSLKGAVKLDGLFQSEKYFFDNLDRPKKYFFLDEDWKNKNQISDDTCIINLRGGEYKRHKHFILPESYWRQAIENMKRLSDVRRFLVVTDDIRYGRSLFPEFDILKGGVGECYASIYNAKYLILSNSSFAYFPVKTSSNSRIVIAPQHWARYGNPFRRWASTANLYESWLWQAPDGQLFNYEECRPECEATEAEYESKYFIHTSQEYFHKTGFRYFVPTALRSKMKRVLSLFFPRHFG